MQEKLVDISCSHWIAIYSGKRLVLQHETKLSGADRSFPTQTFLLVKGLFSTNLPTCAGIPTSHECYPDCWCMYASFESLELSKLQLLISLRLFAVDLFATLFHTFYTHSLFDVL